VSKVILIVLLLVLGVLITPSLRERAIPHVQFALDPVYTWNTRNQLTDMQRFVERSRTLPEPRNFSAHLERERGSGSSTDPWGNPYYLLRTRQTYQIGSPGPDGIAGTADDIVTEPTPVPRAF
jgi:hypothetical protein